MIEIKNLRKQFAKNQVLKGINLQIQESGIYAILGPNGSGKTTLIKCILGMVIPDQGSICIAGQNILNDWQYREKIDYLPQNANFPNNLRLKELIAMIQDLRHEEGDAHNLIELFGLNPFLNKKLDNLSGGTKQKANIVLAFLFDSPLIILDEPTTGLDPTAFLKLKQLIQAEKDKGKIILITSHIMQFVANVADKIIYLLEGQVYFEGSINNLLESTNQADFEHAIAAISQQKLYD